MMSEVAPALALGLYLACGGPLPGWTAWLMPALAALTALTIVNRVRGALREIASSQAKS